METTFYEDGSAIVHDGDCAYAIRDAETGVWSNANVGQTYYSVGTPLTGCYYLPDTSMIEDQPNVLTVVVGCVILVAAVIASWVRGEEF